MEEVFRYFLLKLKLQNHLLNILCLLVEVLHSKHYLSTSITYNILKWALSVLHFYILYYWTVIILLILYAAGLLIVLCNNDLDFIGSSLDYKTLHFKVRTDYT